MADWGPLMINDIDVLLDSAFDDYNNGRLNQAEQKARDVLIWAPSHGDCFYLLGLIAYKKGIFTQAIDLLNLAVRAYPNQKNYQLALAEVYQHSGDYDNAVKIYQKFSDMLNVQAQLGWIALNQKKTNRAKAIFEKLTSTDLAYAGYHGLAFCGGPKDKLKNLKKAFQINPTAIIAKDIVHTLLKMNKLAQVKPYLEYLTDELLHVQCLMGQRKHQESLKILKDYIEKNPYDTSAILMQAVCYENLKDLPQAEKNYQLALSLDKGDLQAHKALARLMMKQGKLSLALDHYQIICKKDPEDYETLLAMASVQEGLGDYSEALGLYFRLQTLNYKGLNPKIKECIEKLALTDKKLAKKFAKGWVKSYPENKTAQKLLKMFSLFLICFCMILPLKAENFSNDLNWDLAWTTKMASHGDMESQYELAQIFEKGIGVPQDMQRAIQYYEMAARQQHFPSMLKLGQILADDKPYQDFEKSLQWYIYAAQNGEVQAQLYLANFYQEAEHYDKNQAKHWLEKALRQLFPDAQDLTKVSPDYERLINEVK